MAARVPRCDSVQTNFQTPLLVWLLLGFCSWFVGSCRPAAPSYKGYGYLIIAPEAVVPSVADFAGYKQSRGFLVAVVTLEEILSDTPGEDEQAKIRNYLKGYSTLTPQIEFVLLVGSMDTVPMRTAYPDPLHNDWRDVRGLRMSITRN